MLCGRSEQLAAIGQLLEGMRSGRAGALVLRGEAGVGQTALVGGAAGKAAGGRGGRGAGGGAEGERAFAGLPAPARPALGPVRRLARGAGGALAGAGAGA